MEDRTGTKPLEAVGSSQLTEAEETERYRRLQREGHHRLPHREYLRARALGVDLPEAEPVYEIGVGICGCRGCVPEGLG